MEYTFDVPLTSDTITRFFLLDRVFQVKFQTPFLGSGYHLILEVVTPGASPPTCVRWIIGNVNGKFSRRYLLPISHNDPLIAYLNYSEAHQYAKDSLLTITVHVSDATPQRLFDTKDLSDLIVRVGTDDLHLHKCILCSVSPVIKAAVQQGSTIVTVNDFSIEVVKYALTYLYDEIEAVTSLTAMDMCEVCHFAEKYEIKPLKDHAVQKIMENFTNDTSIAVLQFAKQYGHSALQCYVTERMRINGKKIFKSCKRKLQEMNPEESKDVVYLLLGGSSSPSSAK